MNDKLDFLARVRTLVQAQYGLKDIANWITTKTKLKGAAYSFEDHEFQLRIVSDYSRVVNCQKCAQVGLTEVMSRYGLGLVNVIPNFNAILTLPYSGDASNFARTRIDPIIKDSPALQEALNAAMDNSEIKQFNDSFIYFRGTSGQTQAISIPADGIISDEIDRSDQHILSQYTSRLNHSAWKLRRNFSTPTVGKYGIAEQMSTSRRFRNLCKCNHCNHWFNPSYFDHVKLPGFDGSLRELTKYSLRMFLPQTAVLLCPKCGLEPSLQIGHREWVQENPSDKFEAAGYFVQPFDAPNLVSLADLITASTEYKRYTEFVNQSLGLVEADEKESIVESDIQGALEHVDLRSGEAIHAFGADMGVICHIVISRITSDGTFAVVHRERCGIGIFQERTKDLCREYRCLMKIIDSQPTIDTVLQLQKVMNNFFGAVFVRSKNLQTYQVKMFDGELAEGKLPFHTVQINRFKALDELMGLIKRKQFVVQRQNDVEDDLYVLHMTDLKRIQILDDQKEPYWAWEKSSQGQDHYHFATLYSYIACRLRQIATSTIPLASTAKMPSLSRIRVGGLHGGTGQVAGSGRTLVRRK